MATVFNIPLIKDDLLRHGNGYCVEEVTPVDYLPSKVTDAWMNLRSGGSKSVPQSFDVLFSLISNFSACNAEVQARGWKAIYGASLDLLRDLPAAQSKSLSPAERQTWQTVLKMTTYLLVQFIECFESQSSQAPITTTTKGRKTKKKASTAAGGGEISWDVSRGEGLRTLLEISQLNLSQLWESPGVDVEFVNLVTGCCYKVLESPAATKDRDVRDSIFHLLGVFIQNYNHGLSASLKIVQLLQHIGEHLVAPLAIAMELFAAEFNGKMVMTETIREISRMDYSELSRDTSGSRALSLFLIEAAERVPAVILPSISLLLPLLDSEAYGMRNAVLCTMCEISLQVLSTPGGDMSQRKTRDQFLDKLEEHIHDVNAFVRSKCLHLWLKLCNARVIPLSRQQTLLDLVISRQHDKSPLVRRSAVQLLTAMLRGNPFAAKLSIDDLKQQLEREKQRLIELEQAANSKESGEAPAMLPEREWEMMSADVEKNLVEAMDKMQLTADNDDNTASANEEERESEQGNEELMADEQLDFLFDPDCEENAEKVLEEIVQALSGAKIRAACRLLVRAHQTWPDWEMADWSACSAPAASENCQAEEEEEEAEKESDAAGTKAPVNAAVEKLRTIFMASRSDQDGGVQLDLEELISRAGQQCAQGKLLAVTAEQLTKQAVIVKYLTDAIVFSEKIQGAIPVMCQLLGSKSSSDVIEAIEFFVAAYQFGLAAASLGIRRMILLMWSSEENVKAAVVEAYRKLYLQPMDVDGHRVKSLNTNIANSLIQLMCGMTMGEVTSMEALIMEWMKSNSLPVGVLNVLWDKVSGKSASTSTSDSQVALLLLSMAAGHEAAIVRNNLDILIEHALSPAEDGRIDCKKVSHACLALTKLVPIAARKGTFAKPMRYPAIHEIFQRLQSMLISSCDNAECEGWISMAEHAVNAIYALAEQPDDVCGRILSSVSMQVLGNAFSALAASPTGQGSESPDFSVSLGPPLAESSQREEDDDSVTISTEPPPAAATATAADTAAQVLLQCSSLALARFISLAGHVALKQLVHLEHSLQNELKRRRSQKEGEQEMKKAATKNTSGAASVSDMSKTFSTTADATSAEEEMGLSGATADDAESEAIRRVCDGQLVCGDRAMLARVQPLLVYVCTNPGLVGDDTVQTAAALALAKFMLVSADSCEENLRLLFTIMEKSSNAVIRANTIIAAGDLTFRFPNLIEPWTPNLYARLRDSSPHVRKHTVMVLTHLILNDMVKVKGQISEMALCLEDENPGIASLAKLFFTELARKGNAIYNILPDIISRLSDPKAGVDAKVYRLIMKYMFSFIQKDKQCESLVEKLCHRFRAMQTERQFQDLSFCLSLLFYSEKGIRKLMENFSCFHDKLASTEVFADFTSIVNKTRKSLKTEQKAVLDELEAKLLEYHNKAAQDKATTDKALSHSEKAAATLAERNEDSQAQHSGKTPRRTPASSKGASRRSNKRLGTLAEQDTPASARKSRHQRPAVDAVSSPELKSKSKPKATSKRRALILSSSEGDNDDDDDDFDDMTLGNGGDDDMIENIDPKLRDMSLAETPRTATKIGQSRSRRSHQQSEATPS